jgi:soluble lytic murein transglycosylase-like protein
MKRTAMPPIKKALLTAAIFGLAVHLTAASAADLRKLYSPIIKRAAERHLVDQELVHVVIRAESNYDPFAISSAGAMGLMQLMPATARQYGVNNVFDPTQNIEGGVRYLKDLVRLYNGQTRLVLAAYNAGQEAVRRYNGIPPYPETKSYIASIMKTYKKPTVSTKNPTFMVRDANGKPLLVNDPKDAFKK